MLKRHLIFLILGVIVFAFLAGMFSKHRANSMTAENKKAAQSPKKLPPLMPPASRFFSSKLPKPLPNIPWKAGILRIKENEYLLLADFSFKKASSIPGVETYENKRRGWLILKGKEKELPLKSLGYSLHRPYEISYSEPYLVYVLRKWHKNSNLTLISQFFLYDLSTNKEKYLGEFKGIYSARFIPHHSALPSLPQSYIVEELISLYPSESSRRKHRLNFYKGFEEGKRLSFQKIESFEGRRGELPHRPCVWKTKAGVIMSFLLWRPTKSESDELLFFYKTEGEKGWRSFSLGEVGFYDYKISPDGQLVAFLLREESDTRTLRVFSLATQAEIFSAVIEGEKRRNEETDYMEALHELLFPSFIRWDGEGKNIIAFPMETVLDGKSQMMWIFNIYKREMRKIDIPFQTVWDVVVKGENQFVLVAGNPLKDTPEWGIYEFYMGKEGKGVAKPIKVFKVKAKG